MKRIKPWQVISLLLLIGIFGARIYVSRIQQKEREQQQQVLYELSRQQLQQQQAQADSLYQQSMDSVLNRNRRSLDEMQRNLDSIGRQLREQQNKFNQAIEK